MWEEVGWWEWGGGEATISQVQLDTVFVFSVLCGTEKKGLCKSDSAHSVKKTEGIPVIYPARG